MENFKKVSAFSLIIYNYFVFLSLSIIRYRACLFVCINPINDVEEISNIPSISFSKPLLSSSTIATFSSVRLRIT